MTFEIEITEEDMEKRRKETMEWKPKKKKD